MRAFWASSGKASKIVAGPMAQDVCGAMYWLKVYLVDFIALSG
jgi:hypothetical protein